MLTPFAHNLKTSQYMLGTYLAKLTPEQADHRNGECNCARWIAGHIAASRRSIARQVQYDLDAPVWLKDFGIGASGKYRPEWPSLDVIRKDLAETAIRLEKALDKVKPEILATSAQFIIPGQTVTVGHNAMFLLVHEAMHVGQLGLIARSFGHPHIA